MVSQQAEKAMEGLVVLIADSNPYTRRLTRIMLTNLGVKSTYESGDGIAAIDAIRAVKLLKPRFVLPIHYSTFPPITQDAGAWAARVKSETRATPVVLQPGEWFEIKKA